MGERERDTQRREAACVKTWIFFSPEATPGCSVSECEATRAVAFRSIPIHPIFMGCQNLLQTYGPGRAGDEVWGCCVISQTFVLARGGWTILPLLAPPRYRNPCERTPDFGTGAAGGCGLCCCQMLPVRLLSWLLFPGLTSTMGAETPAQVP